MRVWERTFISWCEKTAWSSGVNYVIGLKVQTRKKSTMQSGRQTWRSKSDSRVPKLDDLEQGTSSLILRGGSVGEQWAW